MNDNRDKIPEIKNLYLSIVLAGIAVILLSISFRCAPPLSQQLLSQDEAIRAKAVEKALYLPEDQFRQEVLDPLLLAIKNGEVDSSLVCSLFADFGEKCFSGIELLLRTGQSGIQLTALKIISDNKFYSEGIISELFKLTENDNSLIRKRSLMILFNVDDLSSEQIFRIGKHISDPELQIRRMTIEYLRNRPSIPEELIPFLIAALEDDDFMVRQKARFCLAKMGVSAIQGLMEELKKNDPEIRKTVVDILGDMGRKASESAADLYSLLKDGNEDIRISSARALKKMKAIKREQIPEIVAMIKNSSGKYQKALGELLTSLPKNALPDLYPYLKDEQIRGYILKAIDRISPPAKPSAGKIMDLFSRDPYSYFPKSKYRTPLKKKQFTDSEEFQQKKEQLLEEKRKLRSERYYLKIQVKIPEYNLKKKRYEFFMGGYGAGYNPRKERIPKSVDKFYFGKLPFSVRKNIPGYPKQYREEYLFVPVSESTAARIEEDKHNIELGVYFQVEDIGKGSHQFYYIPNKMTYNIKYQYVTTRNNVLVLKNRKTGEVYFYREYR